MKKINESPAALALECIKEGLVTAVFSSPRKTPEATVTDRSDKIKIRQIRLKTGECYQIEKYHGKKVFHKNTTPEELVTLIPEWLEKDFTRAEIITLTGSIQILSNRRNMFTALRKPLKKEKITSLPAVSPAIIQKSHNREKNYILKEGLPVPFLIDLGVMTADGTVIKAKYDKFKQINRFLEYIADILPNLGESDNREIHIIDFGCGKSYLTFAVYYFLAVLHKLPVKITGLDLMEDVIAHCSTLAVKYGYSNLDFSVGNIENYTSAETPDMVISLHACDTATDFALAKAISWNARVILAVPCCQHEMNGQLERGTLLESAFKYGIIKERMAALFTDVLRAEILEEQGYHVQILEFIDMSHTPKNLLIRAVRPSPVCPTAVQKNITGASECKPQAEYRKLRDFLGVKPILESLIDGKNRPAME